MPKKLFFLVALLLVAGIFWGMACAEAAQREETLTTYYPTPDGVYTSLESEKLTLGYPASKPGILTFVGDGNDPAVADGRIYYNTATAGAEVFKYCDGTIWKDLGSGQSTDQLPAVTVMVPFCSGADPMEVVPANQVIGEEIDFVVPGAIAGDGVMLGPPANWTPAVDNTCDGFFSGPYIHTPAEVSADGRILVTFLKSPNGHAGEINCGNNYKWKVTLLK